MHAYMHVCMHVCMHACMYVRTCLCLALILFFDYSQTHNSIYCIIYSFVFLLQQGYVLIQFASNLKSVVLNMFPIHTKTKQNVAVLEVNRDVGPGEGQLVARRSARWNIFVVAK